MFIFAIILLVVAVIAWGLRNNFKKNAGSSSRTPSNKLSIAITSAVAAAALVLGVLFSVLSVTYTQDAGEAKVLKDWTGNIVGQTTTTGLQFKAPWVDTVEYSIRNQQVIFASDGSSDQNGGQPNGPQITVQDADGVTSNIDIALRYSIKPDAVTDIYREFRDEDNFKKSFIEQDVRSVVRLVPNKFSTLDLITSRGEVESAILEALESRWEDDGIIVDSISLQEIRPPAEVVASYAAAQQAQINVEKEKANLDAEEVKAQQKVVNATAEAEANRLLDASLTNAVLESKRLDSLVKIGDKGNLVVVPEGSTPFVNTQKGLTPAPTE